MRPTAVEAGGRQAKQERSLYQHPPVLFTGNLHQSVNQTTRAGESRGAEDRPCLGPREAPSLIDLLPLAEGRRPADVIAPEISRRWWCGAALCCLLLRPTDETETEPSEAGPKFFHPDSPACLGAVPPNQPQ